MSEKIKRIKARTNKRAAQERKYAKLRVVFLFENPICGCCQGQANQVHHMKGRVGDLLVDTMFFLAVCHGCHERIENEPLWARERGYSLSRLAI